MTAKVCECCGRPLRSVYEDAILEAGLTSQERRLFLAVASGAGEPVTHKEIIDAMWGDAAWGGPVDTGAHIRIVRRRINKKLASVGYRLDNIYGFGYRLATIIAEAA